MPALAPQALRLVGEQQQEHGEEQHDAPLRQGRFADEEDNEHGDDPGGGEIPRGAESAAKHGAQVTADAEERQQPEIAVREVVSRGDVAETVERGEQQDDAGSAQQQKAVAPV